MLTEKIKQKIENLLPGAQVQVLDPMQDSTHLEAVVVAPQFEGQPLFKQHQLIMRGLKEEFDTTLHALKLNTYSPTEWEAKQNG